MADRISTCSRCSAGGTVVEQLEPRLLMAAMYVDSNGDIHDGAGNVWVMRGVNQTFWWNTGTAADMTNQIAAARNLNVNAVRAVFNASQTWSASYTSAQRQDYVRKINDQGMVAVYELHDATGKTDAASLNAIVNVITADMAWLKPLSNKVIINIANEWGPSLNTSNSSASWNGYVVPYVNAVKALVAAGWDGLIMIDAPGYGRDQLSIDWWWDDIRNQAGYQNVVYSWHPYGAQTSTITSWLQNAKNSKWPVVVAEYAYTGTQYVPYDSGVVLDKLNALNIGHAAWMWQADGYQHNMLEPDGSNFTDITRLNAFGQQVKAKSLDLAVMPVFSDVVPPTVTSTSINGGAAQRSMVKTLGVTFSEAVTVTSGSLTVKTMAGAAVPGTTVNVANPSGDQKAYVLTFTGTGAIGGSLPDGVYDLTITAPGVKDLAGNAMTGNYTQRFHRLFGDGDGSRTVNIVDYTRLRSTLGQASGGATFNSAYDYDENGLVNVADLAQFRRRFGMRLMY